MRPIQRCNRGTEKEHKKERKRWTESRTGVEETEKEKEERAPRRVPTSTRRGRSTAWTFDWCNLPVQQSEHPLIDVHVHPESQRRQTVAH